MTFARRVRSGATCMDIAIPVAIMVVLLGWWWQGHHVLHTQDNDRSASQRGVYPMKEPRQDNDFSKSKTASFWHSCWGTCAEEPFVTRVCWGVVAFFGGGSPTKK